MLGVWPAKSRVITKVETTADGVILHSEAGKCRLIAVDEAIVRVTYTQEEEFVQGTKPGIVARQSGACKAGVAALVAAGIVSDAAFDGKGTESDGGMFRQDIGWSLWEQENAVVFSTAEIRIEIDKTTASFTYYDSSDYDGENPLLSERAHDSKELERFPVYRIAEGGSMTTEKIQTADGEKTVVRAADKVEDGYLYHTRLWLDWSEEYLYGLGQHEEGFVTLNNETVYVHQANRKIAVPLLVSDKGYGILMDTYSPMIFSDTTYGKYLYTEADTEMDFYFIRGKRPADVIRGYRRLTGKAVMLPKWAFGFLQSQERYETQQEILDVAGEYRRRGLGLDGIVLDWCSWPDNMWGQKTFDAARFPDPREMTDQLHDMDVHFMMSIWPNMSQECDNYREFKEKDLLLPGCDIYNALSDEGRKLYWEQVERALFANGVDSWWCDSSEPITPEWNHFGRPEPAKLYTEYCDSLSNHLPTDRMNAFCLYHAQALYEGQRGACTEKRVLNLTRSGYTGQQRYGTVLWSGDISASWETFRKQIQTGVNFCASGLPYWTVDIGAFFVKHGIQWYWDGCYDRTNEDPAYRELYVRWYQWGAFLPVFRAHGTDCRREIWQFGEEGTPYYDALAAINKLRYELMPYIYSMAGQVWLNDASMIRPLGFDFPEDVLTGRTEGQYMFGDSIMVCPVTKPRDCKKGIPADVVAADSGTGVGAEVGACEAVAAAGRIDDDDAMTWRVYLPSGYGWYDFWTNHYYDGGQFISVDAPLDRIPLFVKAGSILPIGNPATSTAEAGQQVTLRVYTKREDDEDSVLSEAAHNAGNMGNGSRCNDGAGEEACSADGAACKPRISFDLYEDAGDGYDYENGQYTLRRFTWNEMKQQMETEILHDCDAKYMRAEIPGVEVI